MTKGMGKIMIMALACVLLAGIASAGEKYKMVTIPNGLYTAEKGDWVEFKMANGMVQKVSILERSGSGTKAQVTVRTENYLDGKIQDSRRVVQEVGEEYIDPPADREGGEKGDSFGRRKGVAMIGDGEAEVNIIDVYKGDKLLRTWYLTPEIPVYGVLKLVRGDGSTVFETIDFGVAEGAK